MDDKPQTVTSALRQFGGSMTLNEAVKHFGIPKGTIAAWTAKRKARAARGEVVKLVTAPEEKPPVTARATRPVHIAAGVGQFQIPVGNLTDEVRENLRMTVRNTAAFLAPGPSGDAKAFANAARGLTNVLTAIPDLMRVEQATEAPGTAVRADLADAASIRAERDKRDRRAAARA